MPDSNVNANNRPAAAILADFAASLTFGQLPPAVLSRAKLLILDALGCGLAANAYDFADTAVASIQALSQATIGATSGTPGCSLVGRDIRLPVRDAALANGMLIHGLDFDDTHLNSIIHATAACLPAALAMGEALGVTGKEFLTAYAAGMETAIRVGAAAKGGFHHTGFHATGVVAHFSSAVVAAKLLGMTAPGIVAAQGIAASTASGVQVFLEEGAWTKRMHPGWAAVAGITAAYLARGGVKAPTRPYEGKFGFFETHIQHPHQPIDVAAELTTLGSFWELAETAIKPYPVCHFIHGCADSAIALHGRINPSDIASVDAFLARDTMPIVAEPHDAKAVPRNDYEAKFSAHFVVATCLLKGGFGLPDLLPAALTDPVILDLSKRVTCHIDPDSAFPTFFSGGVRITMKDGQTLWHHERINSGAGERALDEAGVMRKFMPSATMTVSEAQALHVSDVVLNLEKHSVGDLADALRVTRG